MLWRASNRDGSSTWLCKWWMGSNESHPTIRTGSNRFTSIEIWVCLRSICFFTKTFHFLMQGPLIFAGRALELQFRMSRPLTDFMATLQKNGIEEKKLSKYVTHSILGDTVSFNIKYVEIYCWFLMLFLCLEIVLFSLFFVK